jgi:hypothetical protein
MKQIFRAIRESAARVAEAWGEANNVDVDVDGGQLVMFQGWMRGSVSYEGSQFGGRRTQFNVAYELKVDGEDETMVMFAQGAPVERFSAKPWLLEWKARLEQQHRDSQAWAVCEAVHKNAHRTQDKANSVYPLYGQAFNRRK